MEKSRCGLASNTGKSKSLSVVLAAFSTRASPRGRKDGPWGLHNNHPWSQMSACRSPSRPHRVPGGWGVLSVVRMLTPLINLLRNTRKGGKGARGTWPGPYSPLLPTPWCEGGECSPGAWLEKALQRRVHCVWKGPESTFCTDYLEGAKHFTPRLRELRDDHSQHSKYQKPAFPQLQMEKRSTE